MSRCAHAQSTYQLQRMPRCRKCKAELAKVMAQYENDRNHYWEWECPKCGRIYQEHKISVPKLTEQDEILHNKLKSYN